MSGWRPARGDMMTWAIDLWNSKSEFCGIDAKSIGYKGMEDLFEVAELSVRLLLKTRISSR